jgi:hypothetical protein
MKRETKRDDRDQDEVAGLALNEDIPKQAFILGIRRNPGPIVRL